MKRSTKEPAEGSQEVEGPTGESAGSTVLLADFSEPELFKRLKMHSELISRLGGISERTIIENNSLHWKIPRRFAARSFNGKNRFTNDKEFGN